jgi:exonuclease V
VEGQLVFGVIDEIRIHHEKKPALGGATPKKYSSQEEWKRKASPKKKIKLDSNQKGLAAFLPGGSTSAELQKMAKGSQEENSTGMFGFVLEDAKTRFRMSIPEVKDQIQSKLQCMLYKRLLEGLVAGLASQCNGARLDMHATPVTADIILALLDLDGNAGLSESFMRDAKELCDNFQLSLQEGEQCNLNYLFVVLASTLDSLVEKAQEGAAYKEDFTVIQDELRLTYRQREGKWSKRGGKEKSKSPKPSQVKDSSGDIRKLLQGGVKVEELDEEAQVEFALQISLEDGEDKEKEKESLVEQSIPLRSPRKAKRKRKDVIIGTVRFPYDSHFLQQHLLDVMAMWKGDRPLRGVTIEQSWRCNQCEYYVDCEWRQMKAEEGFQRVMEKRQADEEQALWSQLDDLPDDMDW